MKYIVNLTSNIDTVLEDGNFRGEPRWERNVLSALIQTNRDVCTTRNVWRSSKPQPSNFYDGPQEDWLGSSTLITHGIGRNLHISVASKYNIVQFHECPFPDTANEFKSYGNRIVCTTDSRNPFAYNKIISTLGKDNVYYLAGPMVPNVDIGADNFRKPYYLWLYRNFWPFIEERPNDIEKLLGHLSNYLSNDLSTRIGIIVGIWDTTVHGANPDKRKTREWILSYPVMQKFKHLYDQIDIFINLDWKDVMSLLKETRMVISPAEPLGCPAFEAAAFGVPVIVNKDVNPFMTEFSGGTMLPQILTSKREVDSNFLMQLDRLQTDYKFYSYHGNAYRNWVKDNASYESYAKSIDNIVKMRGWE